MQFPGPAFRVVSQEPISKDVLDTDVFYFNDKFTSKLIKVKISTVAATKVCAVTWSGLAECVWSGSNSCGPDRGNATSGHARTCATAV